MHHLLDVKFGLQFAGMSHVEMVHLSAGTPIESVDIEFLKRFHTVLVYCNHGAGEWRHPIGDLLADYVDAGYGVVVAPFCTNLNTGMPFCFVFVSSDDTFHFYCRHLYI